MGDSTSTVRSFFVLLKRRVSLIRGLTWFTNTFVCNLNKFQFVQRFCYTFANCRHEEFHNPSFPISEFDAEEKIAVFWKERSQFPILTENSVASAVSQNHRAGSSYGGVSQNGNAGFSNHGSLTQNNNCCILKLLRISKQLQFFRIVSLLPKVVKQALQIAELDLKMTRNIETAGMDLQIVPLYQ